MHNRNLFKKKMNITSYTCSNFLFCIKMLINVKTKTQHTHKKYQSGIEVLKIHFILLFASFLMLTFLT